MRFVFLTIDATHTTALHQAAALLRHEHAIDLHIQHYRAPALQRPDDWQRLAEDMASADFIFGVMLFGEEYVRPLTALLRQATCPVCIIMSNPTLIQCTRIGKFTIESREGKQEAGVLQRLMQNLRPQQGQSEGQRQLGLVRSIGNLLKYLPGKATDLHTYFSVHQFWTNSSPENLRRMLAMLVARYVPGYRRRLPILDPVIYPDTALMHPDASVPFTDLESYQTWQRSRRPRNARPTSGCVGLLVLRTVALSGDTAHIDALVRALEAHNIDVRLAYSAGLDGRPAIEQFFRANVPAGGKSRRRQQPPGTAIDLLVTTAGFALVGGPAAGQPVAAQAALQQLDVGYFGLIPLIFQRVEEWQQDERGLSPMHLAMNVALPELDGAIEPHVYGGPTDAGSGTVPLAAEIDRAAERIARRVALRRKANAEKRLALVLFSFPPTLGNVGTAAYLDVFASIHRLLQGLHADGYAVEVPDSPETLRRAVVEGNALVHGTDGNVADFLSVEAYRTHFPASTAIDPFWGGAPGELLNDGQRFFILGCQFGNVFIGIQPSFGYERDPMRLLMAKDAAPHHGFAAFYTWLNHIFRADAVLHFGTHGAHEFMPGKQAGLSAACWPTRLLGALPNFYYYCVNNPSEGTIAKRRGAATLISYLVPPVQQAGLYKGLRLLKDSLDRYRQQPAPDLLEDMRAQAEQLGLTADLADVAGLLPQADQASTDQAEAYITALAHELLQVEQRMIPVGLHVLGQPPADRERADILALVATFARPDPQQPPLPHQVAAAFGWDYDDLGARLRHDHVAQARWEQVDTICRAAIQHLVEGAARGNAPQQAAANGRNPYQAVDAYLQRATRTIQPGRLTALWAYLDDLLARIGEERELAGLLHALRGGYILPSPGNDVVRNPGVVPTGRNIHGLDPFHIPSAAAQAAGVRLVAELLERARPAPHAAAAGAPEAVEPIETVALVLWGTDNLKTEGEGVAQALALPGARVVTNELGQVADVALIPLAELGRPRIDVVVTVSGIFRDLFGHQAHLIDRALRLAAAADEPLDQNFVRKHALAQAAELGITTDEAAARVFANAPGSYGANVNHLVESGTWDEAQQLGDAFMNRKSFAFGPRGTWSEARPLLERALATVDLTFQNIDSIELGISDIDHYYEYLGGVTKSVELLRGQRPDVLVGEALTTTGSQRVRSLEQMVRLESRAKLLNPKWYEGMLAHGYEGVHEIEARVSNTYGWSATAHAVDGWVYQGVAETFLLDAAMRERLAQLNPHATAAISRRLLEAHSRGFWQADEATLEALRTVYDDLEDLLEGVGTSSG